MSINRGDIFYVNPSETVGSEQRSGRPAIIVSNPLCNGHSPLFIPGSACVRFRYLLRSELYMVHKMKTEKCAILSKMQKGVVFLSSGS